MKVLLTTINSKFIHQNLAVRLLFELNKNYQNLFWKEFINKDKSDDIAYYCSDYEIIAFSCYIWNISKILEVSEKIKKINPKCKILLGGPEVSYDYVETINLQYIDYIIKGEGEIPFSEFLNKFPDIENVASLVWKKSGIVFENKQPEVYNLQNLSKINPYINESSDDLIHKVCYIESSRGCPNTCEFCLAALDNKIRYLPVETVKSNLLYLMNNAKIIKFLDRTFNSNPKSVISIFKFILENYKKGNIFQFEIKADIIQNELIDFIKNNVPKGIFRFEIGIQTLNLKSCNAIKRKQNFENIKSFISQISDKIEIHLDLIVGLPYDYWIDIKFSFEEVFNLFAPELQLGFLKFLKGTAIRNNSHEYGFKFDKLPPYQIIESNYLSKEEITKIQKIEKVLEIYWNKKRTINTLKYIALNYSIFDFLLGLGEYFENKNNFRNFEITDIYTIIYDFSKIYFNENIIIEELIAIDYFLQFKIKPKNKFLSKVDKSLRNKIIADLHLNHHKFRFVIFKIHFDFDKFGNENSIDFSENIIVIQYDGINKPQIINF